MRELDQAMTAEPDPLAEHKLLAATIQQVLDAAWSRRTVHPAQLRDALLAAIRPLVSPDVAAMREALEGIKSIERGWNKPHRLSTARQMVDDCVAMASRALTATAPSATIDPRDSDPTREEIFRDHNCYHCYDGARPCVRGAPNRCEYPRARND